MQWLTELWVFLTWFLQSPVVEIKNIFIGFRLTSLLTFVVSGRCESLSLGCLVSRAVPTRCHSWLDLLSKIRSQWTWWTFLHSATYVQSHSKSSQRSWCLCRQTHCKFVWQIQFYIHYISVMTTESSNILLLLNILV